MNKRTRQFYKMMFLNKSVFTTTIECNVENKDSYGNFFDITFASCYDSDFFRKNKDSKECCQIDCFLYYPLRDLDPE